MLEVWLLIINTVKASECHLALLSYPLFQMEKVEITMTIKNGRILLLLLNHRQCGKERSATFHVSLEGKQGQEAKRSNIYREKNTLLLHFKN